MLACGHAGKLYRDSFVMYDRRTRSEWLRVTGEALVWLLIGAPLEFLPSEVVAGGDWRDRNLRTRVEGLEPGELASSTAEAWFMRDRETAGLWNRTLGAGVEGPLQGRRLKRLPTTTWIVERWRGCFERGRIVE